MFKSCVTINADNTFINTKSFGSQWNCQTSILTNESPHTVNVYGSSQRGRASRPRFIFYRFSPIYKVFVPPKYLSTRQGIITKRFLNLFVGIGSVHPKLDTKLDCITLLEMLFFSILRRCNKTYIYTNHNRTTCQKVQTWIKCRGGI
jgi:hypothetical protein